MPRLLLAAALSLLAPGVSGQSSYDPSYYKSGQTSRVYSMPAAIHYKHEAQWQAYQSQWQAEYAAAQEQNRRAASQSAAVPAWKLDAAHAPPARPPMGGGGPTGPGSVSEFKDTFSETVRDYVASKSRKSGGVFTLSDNGQTYALKLVRVHADEMRMLSPGRAVACADFETVQAPKRRVDLDFELEKDWDWKVDRIYVHGVNGRQRYAYNVLNQRVATSVQEAAAEEPTPKPLAPANLSAEVRFHDQTGDGRLEGGETGGLTVSVKNEGPGPAYKVKLILSPAASFDGLDMPQTVVFGDLKPGESLSKEAALTADASVKPGKVGITLNVSEGNGFDTEPVLVEFETRARQASKLELAGVSLPGGVVKAGAATRVSITIVNSGRGTASGAKVVLRLSGADLFMSGEPTAVLGDLPPGGSKTVEFEFFVNRRLKSGAELPVSVALSDSRGVAGADIPLRLALERAAPGRKVLSVAGRPADAGPEDVDVPPRSKTPADPNAYAVVIGIEKYRDVAGVDYAARDAQAMHDYLTQAMGFKPENVVLLLNERASMTDMTTYLGPWLADRAGENSRVFIYFAGHGAPEPRSGDSYLIPYDGSPEYAETRGYPLKRIYEALERLPGADVIVALDSCFSGTGGRSLLAAGTRPMVRAKAAPTARNVVTLSAARADQISASHHEARHGLLTYFLLKGLRGPADSDGDGGITTLELFRYLKPEVIREARRQHVEQEPSLFPAPEAIGKRGSRVWLVTK